MAIKDIDGYTLHRNGNHSSWPYLKKYYLVDGCNVEGDPKQGLWTLDELDTCKTKKEVLATVRTYKDKYDKIEVWEELVEVDFDDRGWPMVGDKVGQILHTYVKGKLVSKEGMI